MKNYYAILEVPVGCSLEEIRQAYRRLVQENLDNEAVFADLKEAYEALTTPARRAEYDLAAWGETFAAGGGTETAAAARLGRCPMGAEAQCPVLQARIAPTDKYCPECGYLLSTLNADGGYALPAPPESAWSAWLEEQGGQTHQLRPGVNMVGRESADVLLPDKTISRQHARLEVGDDGAVTVEDLSSTNGTQVNDDLLVPHLPRRLAAGDRLRFGSVLTAFHLPEPDRVEVVLRKETPPEIEAPDEMFLALPGPAQTPAQTPALARVVEMHDESARAFPLPPGVTTFGRRSENSVVIQSDPYVSGSHAQIIAEGEVFRLTDVGSTNGTLLNGQRLEADEPVILSPGDIILIGGTALRFETTMPAEEETPETEITDPQGALEDEAPTEEAVHTAEDAEG